jgi:hypothetical protein
VIFLLQVLKRQSIEKEREREKEEEKVLKKRKKKERKLQESLQIKGEVNILRGETHQLQKFFSI